eukprot:6298461-Karenia_brevis.AAC.1
MGQGTRWPTGPPMDHNPRSETHGLWPHYGQRLQWVQLRGVMMKCNMGCGGNMQPQGLGGG